MIISTPKSYWLLALACVIDTGTTQAETNLNVEDQRQTQQSTLQCHLDLLRDSGWNIVENLSQTAAQPLASICDSFTAPVFYFRPAQTPDSSTVARTIERIERSLYSTENRCLFSRNFGRSVRNATNKLIENKGFTFPKGNKNPRDPFEPPEMTWVPSTVRGYDIPRHNLSSAIESLYSSPFIAECAAAKQVAQTASLYEHYKTRAPGLLTPRETGIGVWRNYLKSPAMAARQPLLLNRGNAKHGLRELAKLGHYAFNGQMGYIRPERDRSFIDSSNNIGQNFLITKISKRAIGAIQAREKPLVELSKIARQVWKKYSLQIKPEGSKEQQQALKKQLREQMEKELAARDPFFSEVSIYVHPLGVKTFAYHLARQFYYNPRTPYSLEIYEDYLSGYFFNRHIEHQLKQCQQVSWCRKIERGAYQLIGANGTPEPTLYENHRQCSSTLRANKQLVQAER